MARFQHGDEVLFRNPGQRNSRWCPGTVEGVNVMPSYTMYKIRPHQTGKESRWCYAEWVKSHPKELSPRVMAFIRLLRAEATLEGGVFYPPRDKADMLADLIIEGGEVEAFWAWTEARSWHRKDRDILARVPV